jgi:hypothetical protein
MTPVVGDRVRIERDERRYSSRGTWPQFRGRIGAVVEINSDRRNAALTEYGVSFGRVSARADRPGLLNRASADVLWFLRTRSGMSRGLSAPR